MRLLPSCSVRPSVCPSVCLTVTFVDHVKTNKHIFEIFSPSSSHTILVVPYQTEWRYSDGNPPNGGVECRWGIGRNRDSNSWLSKIAGRAACEMPKIFTDDEAEYMTQSATHHWLSIDCWTRELRSDKNSYRRLCSVDRTVGDAPSNILFVPACNMDEYAEEKRTEKNLIVRSCISEAETTNNKRLRSTFCIEAIQTRSIARPLCDSRASCFYTHELISPHLSSVYSPS